MVIIYSRVFAISKFQNPSSQVGGFVNNESDPTRPLRLLFYHAPIYDDFTSAAVATAL